MRSVSLCTRIVRNSILVSAVLAFGLIAAGCGGTDGPTTSQCASGETRVSVGGDVDCYSTCVTASDCEIGEVCRQGACIPKSKLTTNSSGGDSDGGSDGGSSGGETTSNGSSDGGSSTGSSGGSGTLTGGATSGSGSTSGGETTGSSSGSGSGSSSGGSLGCSGLLRCLQNCGQGNQSCQNTCVQKASPTARQKYQALGKCVQQNCSNASNRQSCIQNKCGSELQACLGSGSGSSGSTTGGSSGGSTTGGSSGGTGTGGGSTGGASLSCSGIVRCLRNCSSRSCRQRCYKKGTPTAQRQYRSLARCVQQNCSNSRSRRSCIQNRCGRQLQACLGGGSSTGGSSTGGSTTGGSTTGGTTTGGSTTGGSTTGGGSLSCSGIIRCLQNCSSRSCQQQCIQRGSSQGRKRFGALNTCARNKCSNASDVQQCLQNKCSSQYNACFGSGSGGSTSGGSTSGGSTTGGSTTGGSGGGSTTGSSGLSCSGIVKCLQNCNTRTCQQRCLQRGSTQGRQRFSSLAQCARNNCRNATNTQQCLQNNCSSQYNACFGSGSGGSTSGGSTSGGSTSGGSTSGGSTTGGSTTGSSGLSCASIVSCMQNRCPRNSRTCMRSCYQAGSATGQKRYKALVSCASNQCSNASRPRACIQRRCSTQYNACFGSTP